MMNFKLVATAGCRKTQWNLLIRAFVVGLCLLPARPAASQQSPASGVAQTENDYIVKYAEVQRAILLFKKGKIDSAKDVLTKAREQHKELPPVGVMMSRLYLAENQLDKAEAALEQVVLDAPDDPEAFVLLGDLALRVNRYAFAQLSYERAGSLLETYDAIPERKLNLEIRRLAGLASVAERRRQFADAVRYLDSWLKLEPDKPLVLGSLGRVHFHAGNHEDARGAFTRLNEKNPTAPPPEIAMGRLYSDAGQPDAGQPDAARLEMESAVKKNPEDIRVVLTVAEWALNNGLMDLAKEHVAKALSLDGESLPGRVLSARLTRYGGEVAAAEDILRDLVSLHPDSVPLIDEFARILATSGDEQKQKAALQHAMRNYSALSKDRTSMRLQAVVTYAWTLFRNRQPAKAIAVVQSLPDGSSLTNENGYYVASIYSGAGKQDVAKAMLRALLAGDAPFPMRAEAEALRASLEKQ